MPPRTPSGTPLRALVLTDRADLAPLAGLLASRGIEAETRRGGEAETGVPAPALAVVDGAAGAPAGDRVKALRAGGARVVALSGGADSADLGVLYEAGADVVFERTVDLHHIVLQCCALLDLWPSERAATRVGEAVFEPGTRSLLAGDRVVRLTEAESRILHLLAQNRGRYVSRDSISRTVFAIPYDRFDRRIDVHLSNLRRKLRESAVGAAIETSRLNGFRLGPMVPEAVPEDA